MAETLDLRPAAPDPAALREAFRAARSAAPVRHRDLAERLGASEGALVAAHVGAGSAPGLVARRLQPRWPALVRALSGVGEVMALTRNAACVHEKTGRYEDTSGAQDGRPVGLVLGPDIDLRLFWRHWAHGFAVHESFADPARPTQRSLQFFDAHGNAVHKVFMREGTDAEAWGALVDRFASDDPRCTLPAAAADAPPPLRRDDEVDVGALRNDWAALRDTHDFFALLRRHGLTRTQALRLADPQFARAVDPGSVHALLGAAAGSGVPVMVFVGNPGTIQIHSGAVRRVEVMGPWLNVLDPGFNLHLRQDRVAQAWVVRKPTTDGLVTALELFDAEGETIAMLFGERKPGRPELCAWRRTVDRLVDDRSWAEGGAAC